MTEWIPPSTAQTESTHTLTMPAVLASRNLPLGTRVSSRLSISERFLAAFPGVLRDSSFDSIDSTTLRTPNPKPCAPQKS